MVINTPAGEVRATLRAGVLDAPGLRYGSAGFDPRWGEVTGTDEVVRQTRPAAFPQRPGVLDGLLGTALSELEQLEDAFTLRVQGLPDAQGLPVLFFIPGGGFTTGSGESRWYDSPELVRTGQMVLVTVNYRLGVTGHFGPLGDPDESTKPIRDLQAALGWVRDNISAFGGDPARITLAGDSAGAWYAYVLSMDPTLRGLAAQTLLISMPRLAPLPVELWMRHRTAVLAALGSKSALRKAPIPAILNAQEAARAGLGPFPYRPAESKQTPADLVQYANSVRRIHTKALLIVTTAEESAAFLRNQPPSNFSEAGVKAFLERTFADPALAAEMLEVEGDAYMRMVRAATLAQFRIPALEIAAHSPVPAQVVRFDHRSELAGAYSAHCFTLPFIFDGTERWRDSPMMVRTSEAEAAKVTKAMRGVISRFLHSGIAGAERYNVEDPRTLTVGVIGTRHEQALEAVLEIRDE
ncbi:carboxylesterase family protein [Arthrobacter globiformis]|uniref:carboxylesterase family protein n=1 Tax=Arthrobacter globiformis TaxID=1665 RepID=UPI00397B7FC4